MMRAKAFIMSLLLAASLLTAPKVAQEPVVAQPIVAEKVIKPKPVKPLHPKEMAERASRSKWNLTQWRCLDMLWTKESHFNPKARNKRSGAYGIAQFMPQTWENYKVKKTSDPSLQIKYGLRYIEKRYGSPCAAWKHHKQRGWY